MTQQAGRGPFRGLRDSAVPFSSVPSWSRGRGWSSQHHVTSARLLSSLVSVHPLGDTCFSRAEMAAWDPSPPSRQETEARTGQTPALRAAGQSSGPRWAVLSARSSPLGASPPLHASLRLCDCLCLSVSVRVSVCLCSLYLFACVSPSFYLSLSLLLSLYLCFSVSSASLPWCFFVPLSSDASLLLPERVPANTLSPASGLRALLSVFILGFWE